MAQVLSQDEVDALLNAVNDDGDSSAGMGGEFGVKEQAGELDANIQPYDPIKIELSVVECPFWKLSMRDLFVNFEFLFQIH